MTPKTWSHPRHPLIEARPLVSFGRPCISGTKIASCFVANRYCAGEFEAEIADHYGVSLDSIRAAIRFELDASAMRAWRKWRRDVSK